MELRRAGVIGLVVVALAAACGEPTTSASLTTTPSSTATASSTTETTIVSSSTVPSTLVSTTASTVSNAPSSSVPPGIDSPCPQSPVPDSLALDPFYQQWCEVAGIPVVAAEVVAPEAMIEATIMLAELLAHRPDVAQALADSPVRVGVMGRSQQTTDMPEWSDLNEVFPETDWNIRARGLGATPERPLVGAGEENVLCLAEDRYLGESIFVHEVAHTILQFGLETVDPTFFPRLGAAYDAALADGRWADTYALTNADEYWAEGVQSFFDTNLSDDFQHNHVDTRAELAAYDPALYELVVEAFGDRDWYPTCPTR